MLEEEIGALVVRLWWSELTAHDAGCTELLSTSTSAIAASRPVQVQRPGVEPLIFRDIFIFRTLGTFINGWWGAA
jgi:aarF domain-containing kinase